jgi:hypothetical protein
MCRYDLTNSSMSTLKSAIELKQVFDRLQVAEQSGMAAEDLRKLEEQAAEQGQRTMWKVSVRAVYADFRASSWKLRV